MPGFISGGNGRQSQANGTQRRGEGDAVAEVARLHKENTKLRQQRVARPAADEAAEPFLAKAQARRLLDQLGKDNDPVVKELASKMLAVQVGLGKPVDVSSQAAMAVAKTRRAKTAFETQAGRLVRLDHELAEAKAKLETLAHELATAQKEEAQQLRQRLAAAAAAVPPEPTRAALDIDMLLDQGMGAITFSPEGSAMDSLGAEERKQVGTALEKLKDLAVRGMQPWVEELRQFVDSNKFLKGQVFKRRRIDPGDAATQPGVLHVPAPVGQQTAAAGSASSAQAPAPTGGSAVKQESDSAKMGSDAIESRTEEYMAQYAAAAEVHLGDSPSG